MTPFDAEGTSVKLEKLRSRMTTIDVQSQPLEVQNLKLLIRALTETVRKTRPIRTAGARVVSRVVPAALDQDWQELVDVLVMKGMKASGESVS